MFNATAKPARCRDASRPIRATCERLEIRQLLAAVPYRWSGELDPLTPPINLPSSTHWYDMAPTPANDKFVVVGERDRITRIYRYNRNGTPDTSFGGTGQVSIDLAYNLETTSQVLVLPDDKILVAGWGQIGPDSDDEQAIFAKFNADGTLDQSFGTGGTSKFLQFSGFMTGLERQSDGKILAAHDGWVVRLNANGSLDTTFGTNGQSSSALWHMNDLLVLPDDRFYTAGDEALGNYDSSDGLIARFLPNGQFDPTFSDDGQLQINLAPGTWDDVRGVSLQGNRLIAVLETDYVDATHQVHELTEVRRIETDGSFDSTFANAPNGVLNTTSFVEHMYDVAIDPENRIVFAGDGPLIRLTPDGITDSLYGHQGAGISGSSRGQLFVWPDSDIVGLGFTSTSIQRILGAPRGDGPLYLDATQQQLIITGTPADETFVVQTIDDNVVVTINGVSSSFPISQVTNITLDARLGYDQITYDVGDHFAGVTNTLDLGLFAPSINQPSDSDGSIRLVSGPIDGSLVIARQGNSGGTMIIEPTASLDVTSNIGATLIGTDGDDLFEAAPGITTGVGSIVHGGATIDARGGNDTFRKRGGSSTHAFLGGDGDDTFDIKTGTGSFVGGAGFDQVVIAPTSTTANNTGSTGPSSVAIGGSTAGSLSGVELAIMSGGTGRDTLRVTSVLPGLSVQANFGAGDDTLTLDLFTSSTLAAGAVTFNGDAGNDAVIVQGRAFLTDTFRFDTGVIGYGVNADSITSVAYANMETLSFDGRQGLKTVHVDGGLPVRMSAFQDFESLAISQDGVVELASLARARDLTITAGGLMDMQNGAGMLVDYSGPSPITDLQSLINTARNGGTWNGTSGITSTLARLQPAHNTTLAVMEAIDYKTLYGANATYRTLPLDDSGILFKYTYYGDVDFNGVVDFDDYSRIDAGFTNNRTGWLNGDVDGNGIVDFDDYSLIDQAFNTQAGSLQPGVSLPDPSTSRGGRVFA